MTSAFTDGAILFPLLAALVLPAGMDGAVLLAAIGAACIAAGLIGLTLLILFLSARSERPVMGWLATGGLALAFFLSFGEPLAGPGPESEGLHLPLVTGWFHVQLTRPSWKKKEVRWQLLAIGLTGLVTQNMLWALGAGVLADMVNCASLGARTTRRSA